MPKAIEHIVDAYIRLDNRPALENLISHRRRLLADLRNRTGYDFSLPIGQIEEEVAVITAGLQQFDRTHSVQDLPAQDLPAQDLPDQGRADQDRSDEGRSEKDLADPQAAGSSMTD